MMKLSEAYMIIRKELADDELDTLFSLRGVNSTSPKLV